MSTFDGSEPGRLEFLTGAHALRLDVQGKTLKPQQLIVADACNASNPDGSPVHNFIGVLMPRRSSKTTTVLAVVLGRCFERDDYMVGFTLCTTGQKARDRFIKDIVGPLLRAYPDEATRPFTIRRAAGSERITWDNGSVFQVLTPSGEAFRSDAYDCVLLDEAGEADPEMTKDLLAGVLPTLDTRPNAQVIISGTAAKYRTGNLLWDTLADGRDGIGTGIVEYSAPDYLTADDIETWELTIPIVSAVHPGIRTLTTLEKIKLNYDKLPRADFIREYLSVFEDVGATLGIVNAVKWLDGELPGEYPSPPKHFALAIAAAPSQQAACIVAAWREGGVAYVLELEHREGVAWLAPRAVELARKYGVQIVHDSAGVILAEAEQLQRARPRPKLAPQTFRQITTAAALFVKETDTGNLKHWKQDTFSSSVLLATKRKIGASAWAFGRPTQTDDITSIEAASMALRSYDETPAKQPVQLVF